MSNISLCGQPVIVELIADCCSRCLLPRMDLGVLVFVNLPEFSFAAAKQFIFLITLLLLVQTIRPVTITAPSNQPDGIASSFPCVLCL